MNQQQEEKKEINHEPPKELMEPFFYISQSQGKGVRHLMMAAFNKWLQIDEERLQKVSELIAILHNASLMIDDIEDNSRLRRGIPVCHMVYGIPNTINTANYMYFIAMEKVYNTGSQEAIQVFLEELLNLHRGQGFDIFWRDNNSCPTEEEYNKMVLDKTGGLFRLSLRLMQAFSNDKRDYIPLVNLLGLYFQIRDDYNNLKSDDYQKNKSFAEDLSEGKFSFPIIHAIRKNASDTRLLNILKRRTDDEDLKRHAIKYMEEQGSFEYTRVVMENLSQKIRESIEAFGGNSDLNKLLDMLESIKT